MPHSKYYSHSKYVAHLLAELRHPDAIDARLLYRHSRARHERLAQHIDALRLDADDLEWRYSHGKHSRLLELLGGEG